MNPGPPADAGPSRSAAGWETQRALRIVVWCEVAFVLTLLAVWIASRQVRESANLLLFFLYGIPCEFLVSIAPHEPAVLYVAKFHDPMIVALVAGAGTLVAEALNYPLLQRIGSTAPLRRLSRARALEWLMGAFARAPFAALWIAGFVPVIPFMPFRVLVLLHQYPRGRYLAAAVSSRTARFFVVALAGNAVRLPVPAIGIFFLALTVAVTLPGVYRVLARKTGGIPGRNDALPHEDRHPLRAS